jgi:hypothetical protein
MSASQDRISGRMRLACLFGEDCHLVERNKSWACAAVYGHKGRRLRPNLGTGREFGAVVWRSTVMIIRMIRIKSCPWLATSVDAKWPGPVLV